ncbi:hypothetical protein [Shewanella dokdonensis]|uniref:Glycine zipper domain-containing protein n=1 Tax=Shewanella dokdonensis TaxID=712036 RepID=A0ABX8DEY8_9GAMM|nr:hypothetical protein [Shewanella dokdonensis]MCL1076491.1 hypothetical protein [Shewanella dokdonensis]QVK23288.1 hypothetical protein KHX94_00115 [Shewanella dokdonensis]
MRLYVVDKSNNEKTYLKQVADDRKALTEIAKSERIRVKDKVYSIREVMAEADNKSAPAMALGSVVGVLGGVPGVIIGGIIGGLLGKSSDDSDRERAERFNRS